MQFRSRWLSKDLSVYFQGLCAFGWADEWTWLKLWSTSNACPVGPCPSRNRISRSSHPVTLTDLPSTGSSWNSSWHTMTCDKANFNPFLWEILQPVHMEGGPKKKPNPFIGPFRSDNLRKSYCILDFTLPYGLLLSQGQDKERITEIWPAPCGLKHELGQQRWSIP